MKSLQERIEELATRDVRKPIDRDTFYKWYNRYVDRECTIGDVAKACGVSYEIIHPLIYATAFGYPLPKHQFTDQWTDEYAKELKKKQGDIARENRNKYLKRLREERAKNGK